MSNINETVKTWNEKAGNLLTDKKLNLLVTAFEQLKKSYNIDEWLALFNHGSRADLRKIIDASEIAELFIKKAIVNTESRENILTRLFSVDKNAAMNALWELKIGQALLQSCIPVKSEPPVGLKHPEYEISLNPLSYVELVRNESVNLTRSCKFREEIIKVLSYKDFGKNLIVKINFIEFPTIEEEVNLLKKGIIEACVFIKKQNKFNQEFCLDEKVYIQINNDDSRGINHFYNRTHDCGLACLASGPNQTRVDIGFICRDNNFEKVFNRKNEQFRDFNYPCTLIVVAELIPSEKVSTIETVRHLIENRRKLSSKIKDVILINPGYSDNSFGWNYLCRIVNPKCQMPLSVKLEKFRKKLGG